MRNCSGLFKCISDVIVVCVHPTDVCNRKHDCSSGDDEYFCDLPRKCPNNCTCLMYAAICYEPSDFQWPLVYELAEHYVFLQFTRTAALENAWAIGPNIAIFVWQNSNVSNICNKTTSRISSKVQLLDFSSNKLKRLTNACFQMGNLHFLFVNHNQIYFIHPDAFKFTEKLLKCDFSSNSLHTFTLPKQFIALQFLNITDNSFKSFDEAVSQRVQIQLLSTNDPKVCCLLNTSVSVCSSSWPWPLTCERLLSPLSAKISLYMMVFILCLLNMLSLILMSKKYHKMLKLDQNANAKTTPVSKGFMLNTLLVHINDTWQGICLVLLIIYDEIKRDHFFWYVEHWLQSFECLALGFFVIFLTQDSLFLLNLLSLSRLLVVKYPFKSMLKKQKNVGRSVLLGKMVFLLLNSISLFVFFVVEEHDQVPFKTCRFVGQTSRSGTVLFFTILVTVLQMTSLFSIYKMYCMLYKELQDNLKLEIRSSSEDKPHKKVLIHAVLIVTSSALCWLPSSVIYIITVTVARFPPDILMWNTVLIAPVVSVMNPVIYCLYPALKQKRGTNL